MQYSPNQDKDLSFVPVQYSIATTTSVFSSLWKVKIPKKVKNFAQHILLGRLNTLDCVQKHSSFFLLLRWCMNCRRHKEDVNHLMWECQFTNYLWNPCQRYFGVSEACNRDGWSLLEEVLLHLPFRERGKCCGMQVSLLLCGVFGLSEL